MIKILKKLLSVLQAEPEAKARAKKPEILKRIFNRKNKPTRSKPKPKPKPAKPSEGRTKTDYFEEHWQKQRAEREYAGEWLPPYVRQKIKISFIIFVIISFIVFMLGGINVFSISLIGVCALFLIIFTFGLRGFFTFLKYAVVIIALISILFFAFSRTDVGKGFMSRINIGPIFEKMLIAGKIQAQNIESKITGVGDWTNPYAEKREEPKGIEIRKIIVQQSYLPGKDIEIGSVGFVRSLEEPTIVSFSCSLDGVPGKITEGKETIPVQPNKKWPFGIGCTVKTGEITEDPSYKDFKFNAKYTNYITKATLKLWVLKNTEQEKLVEAGINIFDKYRDDFEAQRFDPLLQLDEFRTTRNSYRYGPLIVSMEVFEPQPLSEGRHKLFIDIKNDKLNWKGNITGKDNKLTFKFPSNVYSDNCDETILKEGRSEYTLSCDFNIDSIEKGLNVIEIKTEVVYDYEFTEEKTILVSRQGATEIKTESET